MNLITNIIINNLDIFMYYYLYFKLMNQKMKVNGRDIVVSLIWGTMHGVFINYVDIQYFKIILYFSIYLYTLNLCRKKLYEALIINVIIFLTVIFAQLFVLVGTQIYIKIINFQPYDNFIAFSGQVITVLCVLLICKLPIHKIYEVIQKDILLRLLFYSAIITVFVIFNREFVLVEVIRYTPFFIIILFGIYHTVRSISYYRITKYSSVYHDMRNLFFGIFYATQCSYDIETLKDMLQGYYDVLGFDMKKEMINAENAVNIIDSLVELKIKESGKKIQVIKDINYYTDNSLVPISSLTYMISVMLDYSLDVSQLEDRIAVYIHCSEYKLNMKVSHKYQEKHDTVLKLMNKKRMLNEDKLGHGLSNLKKMVLNYNGEISAIKNYGDAVLIIDILN